MGVVRMKRLRKNGWKIVLDILMAILLVLMYNKRVLGMSFHEIGGLALCGLFIIHQLLNLRWIKAVTTGLFSRRTPARQKLYWVLDLLLFVSYGYILFSGIMISKIVFPTVQGSNVFKMGHYAAAALALALTGVHVGLHIGSMRQRIPFLRKLPTWLRRGFAILLSVAVLVFGGMQLTSTSFIQWLGNIGVVFGAQQTQPEGFEMQNSTIESSDTTNTVAVSTDVQEGTVELSQTTDITTATAETTTDTSTQTLTQHGGGAQDGKGPHGSGGEGGSSTSVLDVILSFLSIMLAFSAVTAWADGILQSVKRKRRLAKTKVTPFEA